MAAKDKPVQPGLFDGYKTMSLLDLLKRTGEIRREWNGNKMKYSREQSVAKPKKDLVFLTAKDISEGVE